MSGNDAELNVFPRPIATYCGSALTLYSTQYNERTV